MPLPGSLRAHASQGVASADGGTSLLMTASHPRRRAEGKSKVHQLTTHTFNDAVSSGTWIVAFTAPW